jgi:hypothetical protein
MPPRATTLALHLNVVAVAGDLVRSGVVVRRKRLDADGCS